MPEPYDDNNIFAKILRGDLPSHKVHEDDDTMVIMDIMPRGDGHCLVLPKQAARNLLDADDGTIEAVSRTTAKMARAVVKAGFDLRSDQKQLKRLLKVYAQPMLDLDFVFSGRGYPRSIGVKAAIALLFERRLLKSKRVTTSNWANPRLEARQILYAANDAYAAWAVLDALKLPLDQLPVWHGEPDSAAD